MKTFLILAICTAVFAQTAPYPPSPVISSVTFNMSTVKTSANGSDNWVITWADNDHQYTSWGDGGGFGGTGDLGRVSMGVARVEGTADSYSGHNVWGGYNSENPAQFSGKSYGIISIGGTMYMWRCGSGSDGSAYTIQDLYKSTSHGASWSNTGVQFTPSDFSGNNGFFAVTFCQFGRDYADARDNYVYMYGPEIQNSTWDVQKPGKISLFRALKTQLTNRSSYEFFTGTDGSGTPQWSTDRNARMPVWQDAANGVMRTSVIYNPGLNRYFLITQQVSRMQTGNGHIGIYDAPEPWGPWTTVLFENAWSVGQSGKLQTGSKTVYWNFSPKWWSNGGMDFVLVYTGPGADNWGTVEGSFTMRAPSGVEAPQHCAGGSVFSLEVSPNPFSGRAEIRMSTGAVPGNGQCRILGINGRVIEKLEVRGSRAVFSWRPAQAAPGPYIVAFESGQYKAVRRVMLIK